ncbi:Gfo/Idh/MocA family protein [Falsirhodobacter halotolerans]|uniref:Gfo/Idh/MocA family protein n=1 Tax=Falsirhodobacter halotolerans TaxID=1146892 RepID=UPI001FD12E04|nr:Gfo/Idh/MocA family oxidoreductase [Falsirhodobacter halotolerans]MCJ8141289.1 Gfo/Idh/MocA family oxidoreductase [Falsirhodobacter halotolerans]
MRPLRLGMVGGGTGAFIGAVHRIAARMDGRFDLVAGTLSSDAGRARTSGLELGLAEDRIYTNFAQMAEAEAARADGIEVVSIVTPNHLHAAAAIPFLKAGIHVICDKPLTATMADAQALADVARTSPARFLLTHTYSGYAMVRQARAMVAAGAVGRIRVVQVEYAQDWLTEDSTSAQAMWRVDPDKAGGGAVGDIGSHAWHLLRFVTGLRITELAADMSSMVPGRRVDDNVQAMLRLEGGARGALWASQVAPGHDNTVRIRVFGDKGGLDWTHDDPGHLWFTPFGSPRQRLVQNGPGAVQAATQVSRVPAGHPEGYLEAFANLYAEAARLIRTGEGDVPGLQDGLDGMAFIAACQRSSAANGAWVTP